MRLFIKLMDRISMISIAIIAILATLCYFGTDTQLFAIYFTVLTIAAFIWWRFIRSVFIRIFINPTA